MRKFLSAAAVVLFLCLPASAQVVFKGPVKAEPNRMVSVYLSEVKGTDLKITTLVNGRVPKDDDTPNTFLFKTLDDKPVILTLAPVPAVYSFIAAVSHEGKTHQSVHVLSIEGAVPPGPTPPPPPGPNPPPNPPAPTSSLFSKLMQVYKVQVDTPAADALLAVYKEVAGSKYRTFGDLELVITSKTTVIPGSQAIRTVLADHLLAKLGDDPRRYDMDKAQAEVKAIAEALQSLPR